MSRKISSKSAYSMFEFSEGELYFTRVNAANFGFALCEFEKAIHHIFVSHGQSA
jgi:hypothetical protein